MTTHWGLGVASAVLLSGALLMPPASAGTTATPGGLPHATAGTALVWGDDVTHQVSDTPAGDFVDLEAGYDDFVIGLTPQGHVIGWGYDEFTSPPPLPAGTTYVAIAAGDYTAVALRSDGVITQWGNLAPTGVPAAPPGTHYVQLAAGDGFGLALRSDSLIDTWGDDSDGISSIPPLPSGQRYTQIAAGEHDGYALRSDGQVIAWGDNGFGQKKVPPLPAGVRYTKIVAQSLTAYALRSDGMISAWGDPELNDTAVPPLPSGTRYVDVGIGLTTGYAERSDGSAVTWGYNGAHHLATLPPAPPGMRYGDLGGSSGISFALLQREVDLTTRTRVGSVTTVTVKATTVDGTVPTGQVRITEGGRTLAHGALTAGRVTLTLKAPPGKGIHHFVASYAGDRSVLPQSTSFAATLTRAPSTTRVHAAGHVRRGRSLTARARVTPAVTGLLRWYDGTRRIATTHVRHGRAVAHLNLTKHGRHRLHAVFAGTATTYSSLSPTITVVVR